MEASNEKPTQHNEGTNIELKAEGKVVSPTDTTNSKPSPSKSTSPPAKSKRSKSHSKTSGKCQLKKAKEKLPNHNDDSDSSFKSSTTTSSHLNESSEEINLELKRNCQSSKNKSKSKKKSKLKKSSYKSSSDSSFESSSSSSSESQDESCEESYDPLESLERYHKRLIRLDEKNRKRNRDTATAHEDNRNSDSIKNQPPISIAQLTALILELRSVKKTKKVKKDKKKNASKLEYKRVDELWDNNIHNYKLTDTTEDGDCSEYDEYLFTVRRTFDWEGKFKSTTVDIKSKLLKEILCEAMNDVKGVSLVEETPSIDPNLLFLYLDDLRKAYKVLKKQNGKLKKREKALKTNETKRKHFKILLKYLDKEYSSIKKTLYPMLDSGLITYDLLWALYKPNTLVFTSTYGSAEEPRVFKVELAEKESSLLNGEWYNIEGRYLEYDGKIWGMGTMECNVPLFRGARKISSLNCYPLKYHHNEEKIRIELIERGKKFVLLQGLNYKCHEGMAFFKKRKQIVKVNINGRIMIDPATHRRILPNYNVSTVKLNDSKPVEPDSESCNEKSSDSEDGSDDEQQDHDVEEKSDQNSDNEPEVKLRVVQSGKENIPQVVEVPVDEDGQEIVMEKLEEISDKPFKIVDGGVNCPEGKKEIPIFTDEEYLIASPVVLGFAFAEKLWLEFTVRGIKDIIWNDGAYDSLVLEDSTKAIVKALVNSHKYHPAKNIDDVIQGKGRGLVAVLHGPPGTGKTLTAEGISELLKCPLYMVSASELGTDPRTLESELQKILDIAHAWGAVLLLDEADVFLEKRTSQDIHRNALVSIFLRHLEYYQGVLFLTTNRVQTFDEAFQSRIHIAIRYGELSMKARRVVFQIFLERARVVQNFEAMPFTEEDLDTLSKHSLNGRQIKNTIRTAQALAIHYDEMLSMDHIKTVLDMSSSFDRDLKGGPGFEEAMRGYF